MMQILRCDSGKHELSVRRDQCPFCEIDKLKAERSQWREARSVGIQRGEWYETTGPFVYRAGTVMPAIDKPMSRRDHFAAAALIGFCIADDDSHLTSRAELARNVVQLADALIAELDKP